MQKTNKYFMLAGLSLLVAASISGTAHAESAVYQTEVGPSINITIPTNLISVFVDPSDQPFDYAPFSISVSTNNDTGYYMTMSSNSTSLLKTDDTSKTIPTLSTNEGGYTDETFEVNKWGYKIGAGNYIPFVSGATIANSDESINDDTTDFTFATKVDYLQPSGIYQTVLDFFAVANPTIMAIQNLDPAFCTEDPLVVADARDGEEYMIQRLADGNCWMLDNLRLDPTETSLVSLRDRTNAPNEALAYLKNGGGTEPYPANGVEAKPISGGTDKYTPYVISQYKDYVKQGTPGVGSGKTGVFYNVCSASAGSYCYESYGAYGDVQYDICPAGWRLPTGHNNGEYKKLYNAVASTAGSSTEKERNTAFVTALSFPLVGGTWNEPANSTSGFYWTSTASTSLSERIELEIQGTSYSTIYFTEDKGDNNIFAVRCIMRYDISTAEYLQDITPPIARDTAVGTSKILKDKRDNEEYKVAKLADGNLWMLDNLRLDPTAISQDVLGSYDNSNTNAGWYDLRYLKEGGGNSSRGQATEAITAEPDAASNYFTTGHIEARYKDVEQTTPNGTSKAGVYYNFCAASAGTYCYPSGYGEGNATSDICPANWHLPSSHRDGTTKDFLNLQLAYNNDATAIRTALNDSHSGVIWSWSSSTDYPPYNSYSTSYIWSSTRETSTSMDYYYSGFGGTARECGMSVRCIARTEENINSCKYFKHTL